MNGSSQYNSPRDCDCSDRLADRLKTSCSCTTSQLVDVSTSRSEAELDQATPSVSPVEDHLTRGKRLLEQSTHRVKKARLQAKKDMLQLRFLEAKERLDQCQLTLIQAEESLDDCPLRLLNAKTQNVMRIKDKRQLFLMDVIKAEEAILDYSE